ncbi:MAG: hypothetical protein ACI9MB_003091 [Verrucomicrobiales bacterium]|jgi:hypothetical protein
MRTTPLLHRVCIRFLLAGLIIIIVGFSGGLRAEEQSRIWITPQGSEAGNLVLHWQSENAGDSRLRIGKAGAALVEANVATENGIFHAEIPVGKSGDVWCYQIGDGQVRNVNGWGGKALRIAFVADWHGNAQPGSEAILRDDPQLLVTAGDNVTSLHNKGKEGIKAYAALVESAPELFARVPVMPVVGNHDNEIRPRGKTPPTEAVYDVTAETFRMFFGLPEDGWRRPFQIPAHGISLVALDLHHTSDFGTTWQTGHAFDAESDQLKWLQEIVANDPSPFRIFIYNEQNSRVRTLASGAFGKAFRERTGVAVTGFGGYTERAEWEGFPSYNTHIHGGGTDYADSHRAFATGKGAYLLLTHIAGEETIRIEIKNHAGEVLDTRVISVKPGG